MLHAEAQLPIGEDDEGEGFVKPAVGGEFRVVTIEREPGESWGVLCRTYGGFRVGRFFWELGLVWGSLRGWDL